MNEVNALKQCFLSGWDVFNAFETSETPWLKAASEDDILNILKGMAFGFRGNYETTDCSTTMAKFSTDLEAVGISTLAVFSSVSFMDPFYKA
jgi:hypothetical protein